MPFLHRSVFWKDPFIPLWTSSLALDQKLSNLFFPFSLIPRNKSFQEIQTKLSFQIAPESWFQPTFFRVFAATWLRFHEKRLSGNPRTGFCAPRGIPLRARLESAHARPERRLRPGWLGVLVILVWAQVAKTVRVQAQKGCNVHMVFYGVILGVIYNLPNMNWPTYMECLD